MSSDLKYNSCFVVEEIFKRGNTTKSRCLGVRVEAQANGKEPWINKRPTTDGRCSLIGNEHHPTIRRLRISIRLLLTRTEYSSEHNPKIGHSTYLRT